MGVSMDDGFAMVKHLPKDRQAGAVAGQCNGPADVRCPLHGPKGGEVAVTHSLLRAGENLARRKMMCYGPAEVRCPLRGPKGGQVAVTHSLLRAGENLVFQ